MSEIAPTTTDPVEPGTGGGENPPTATPTAEPTQPVATEEAPVTLSQKDYKALVAARDRANNANEQQASFINTLAQERGISQFLESNKTKYPDLTMADLIHVEDPADLEAEATRVQKRLEDAVQNKLLDVQKADVPAISPEDADKQLKELRDKPRKGGFGRMLEIRSQTKR